LASTALPRYCQDEQLKAEVLQAIDDTIFASFLTPDMASKKLSQTWPRIIQS